jgi:hypothetical protein
MVDKYLLKVAPLDRVRTHVSQPASEFFALGVDYFGLFICSIQEIKVCCARLEHERSGCFAAGACWKIYFQLGAVTFNTQVEIDDRWTTQASYV